MIRKIKSLQGNAKGHLFNLFFSRLADPECSAVINKEDLLFNLLNTDVDFNAA